ncbi:MAG: GNAT family N-acetyltransferase [Paludibacter sp.]|nr:GNAT family N-acetyltransferase [Paludibacter sp.]
MTQTLQFEFCNWDNALHTNAFLDLLNHYMSDPMGDYPILQKEEQLKLLKGLKSHPTAEVLLMKAGDQFVGMSTTFVNYSTFKIKPYLYIHDVVILDSCRGKGYGKALIQKLIDISQERGYCKLTLEVREDNPGAQKLYQTLGFKECEPRMFFWTREINHLSI